MMKLAFFGSAEFAVPTLELVAKAKNIELVLVVTKPDKPAGRGLKLTPTPIKIKAQELNLKVQEILPKKIELEQLGVQKIVVVAYGLFIPEEIFTTWPCINLHPSLLPKYRGPSPLQSALLNGDKVTGVTTMLIDKEMDAGDILLQQEIPITENMDIRELHDLCADMGAQLILETLTQDIQKIRRKQDSAKAVICKKITDADSKIIPGEPAEKIHNKVRAVTGYLESAGGKRIKILKTRITPEKKLEILIVQTEGRPKMSYTEYLKGNPEITL